jgi:hypothetical protein
MVTRDGRDDDVNDYGCSNQQQGEEELAMRLLPSHPPPHHHPAADVCVLNHEKGSGSRDCKGKGGGRRRRISPISSCVCVPGCKVGESER